MNLDFDSITRYGKSISGLTAEHEALLVDAGGKVTPHLSKLTDELFRQLKAIPEVASFIEGQFEILKNAHSLWLSSHVKQILN